MSRLVCLLLLLGLGGVHAQYQLSISPKNVVASTTTATSFTLSVLSTSTKAPLPWSQFVLEHDRKLHALVFSSDLAVFMHVHPEDFGSVASDATNFSISVKLPMSGNYLVACSFQTSGVDYMVNATVSASAGTGTMAMGSPMMMPMMTRRVQAISMMNGTQTEPVMFGSDVSSGYFFNLSMNSPSCSSAVANKCSQMRLMIKDSSGSLLSDLTPYLSAIAHVAVISTDLKFVAHGHAQVSQGAITCSGATSMPMTTSAAGMGGMSMRRKLLQVADTLCSADTMPMSMPSTFSAPVDFFYTFPSPGYYKVIFQLARGSGTQLTADLTVLASASATLSAAPAGTLNTTSAAPSPGAAPNATKSAAAPRRGAAAWALAAAMAALRLSAGSAPLRA